MEKSIQALNHQEKIAKWSERIAACRSSGISVRTPLKKCNLTADDGA